MRTTIIAAAVAALLACAGCGGDGAQRDSAADPTLPPSTTASATSSSEAPPSEADRSDRGNIIKALGQEAGLFGLNDTDHTGPLVMSFTIDAIRPDVQCNSGFASPPDHGHYIGIDLRASTSPDYPADELFMTFGAQDFKVIGPDGLTVSDVQGAASMCLGPNGFTSDPLGPGQKYAGTVVIDSPVTSGVLVYAPMGETTGWEWQF